MLLSLGMRFRARTVPQPLLLVCLCSRSLDTPRKHDGSEQCHPSLSCSSENLFRKVKRCSTCGSADSPLLPLAIARYARMLGMILPNSSRQRVQPRQSSIPRLQPYGADKACSREAYCSKEGMFSALNQPRSRRLESCIKSL